MKESLIQRDIRLAIGGDVVLWRNETGKTVPVTMDDLRQALHDPSHIRRMMSRGLLSYGLCNGSSDLIGIDRRGRFVAIEVKRPGGERRPEQKLFIDLVKAHGGLAGFATSVEEARSIIEPI